MQTYEQGAEAYFTAEVYDHPGGSHVDPTALALTFVNVDGGLVAGPFNRPAVERLGLGLFAYTWTVPADLAPGVYTATWAVTVSTVARVAYETFGVSPAIQGTWANLAEVAQFTGETVTASLLHQAQVAIDIHAGRTFAARDRVGTRDQGWLKYAVAYQAAWMKAQPDFARRMDFTTVVGAGAATRDAALTPTGMVLAPMARWALKRVSWLKSRSLHVRSDFTDLPGVAAFENELSDDFHDWTPMGRHL